MIAKKAIIPLVCLLLLTGPALAASQDETQTGRFYSKFSIKLSGGITSLPGGDMKDWFEGESSYYSWLGSQPGYSTQKDFSLSRSAFLPTLEIMWKALPQFGVSLGVGYFKKSWEPSSSVTYNYGAPTGSDTLQQTLKREVTVIPITITGMYILPVQDRIDINLFAGMGYYITSLSFSDDILYSWPNDPLVPNYQHTFASTFEPKTGTFGIHFGAGAEIALFSRFSLTADILYRLAKVGELKTGQDWKESFSWTGHQESTSGTMDDQTLWFGKSSWEGGSYNKAVIGAAAPSWLAGSRAFEFGLSGLVFRVGLKIGL